MNEQRLPAEELARFGQVEAITSSMFDKVVETELPAAEDDERSGRVRTRLQRIDMGDGTHEAVGDLSKQAAPLDAKSGSVQQIAEKRTDEELALEAVRDILVEERRAHSRKALPALPPVEESEADASNADHDKAQWQKKPDQKGIFASVIEQIKKDTALLINASLWSFLAIVALGNSAISPMLILQGLFFLFCFACVFRPEILAGVIRDVMRNFGFAKHG